MMNEDLKRRISSSPAFILNRDAVVDVLRGLDRLRSESGCKILYSIKSLPLEALLEWAKLQVDGFSVSSVFEARLAHEVLAGNGSIHLTTPGIKAADMNELSHICQYISFNSISQLERLNHQKTGPASVGLRVNPGLSFIEDARYDPCRKYSKLGAPIKEIQAVPEQLGSIEGLHIHTVFSSQHFTPLIKTLELLESELKELFSSIKWINLGGGYLFQDPSLYPEFINLVVYLRQRYSVEVFIEPGNAIVGHAGFLLATVTDIFKSDGKVIAVLDTSINHHPEVFEYQMKPELVEEDPRGTYPAILAGSTCMAGDFFGEYLFSRPLQLDDRVVFRNVGAYSLVKAHRFNGYNLPDIYSFSGQTIELLKQYDYQAYRSQWITNREKSMGLV